MQETNRPELEDAQRFRRVWQRVQGGREEAELAAEETAPPAQPSGPWEPTAFLPAPGKRLPAVGTASAAGGADPEPSPAAGRRPVSAPGDSAGAARSDSGAARGQLGGELPAALSLGAPGGGGLSGGAGPHGRPGASGSVPGAGGRVRHSAAAAAGDIGGDFGVKNRRNSRER